MQANEAAEISDLIVNDKNKIAFYRYGARWKACGSDNYVDINKFEQSYTPYAPVKQYKIGDAVTLPEALQSGLCFEDKWGIVYRWNNSKLEYWSLTTTKWLTSVEKVNNISTNISQLHICEDPSVTTIRDLKLGTIFLAIYRKNVERQCIMVGDGEFFVQDFGGVWGDCDKWKLVVIKENDEWRRL